MKILIILFAVITFVLMASDPRRNASGTTASAWKNPQKNDNLALLSAQSTEESKELS